jgi:hypothetical protein
MDHSKTVYLNTAYQAITGLSPFTLTINPSGISTSNKVYKIAYNFGDGTLIDRVVNPDNDQDFLKTEETYVYYLTGNIQKTFNINVHAYQFNTSLYNDYTISLNLKTPPLEKKTTSLSALSSFAYFDELHLVGSRMFGTNNEVLYMFESINPNYVLPVMVNWKSRPLEAIVKTIDNSYSPYKLLAPFENEATTSIDTGTNIVTYPDVNAAPNPDYGSPNMELYEGDVKYSSLSAGLLGYWKFNEASGNRYDTTGNNNTIVEVSQISNFIDSTGNDYTLTNYSNGVNNGTGIISGDAVFDGFSRLSYTGGAIVAASSPITVCGWVYGSELTDYDQRLYDDTMEYGIQMSTAYAGVWSPNFQIALYSPYPLWIDTGLQFTNNQWNFFAITIDSSNNLTSYVNSQSYTQVIDGNYGPWGTGIPTVGMGDIGYGYGAGLNGQLDEMGIWSRALSPSEITTLYNNTSAITYPFTGNAGLLTDIEAYWNFDVLNFPTPTISSTTGVIDDCAYITDGNDTWFKLPAGICDPSNQPKSYSLWFKLDQTNVGYQFILGQGENSDQRNIVPFYLENNSTLNTIFTRNGFSWTNSINTSIVPTANEWHHVVLTLNGSVARLYYDGALVGSNNYSGTIQSTNSRFTLGHYNPYPNGVYGTDKFVGKVDEFGIWSRELSLSEVSFIYNNRRARGFPYPYPYNQ